MKAMKILSLLCLLVFGFISDISAQERFVKPVDEAARDASFPAFRAKLLDAAKRRDAKYVLSIVDRNIKNSFGGDDGISEFKKMWKLESKNSKFWDEFVLVLSNGGTFYKEGRIKTFQAPYTFTGFPEDLDAFTYHAIFGDNVNLRSKPEPTAPVVASLSRNVVKVDFENSLKDKTDEYSWLKITTLGGKTGYVQAKYVRSPIDYRAIFEKRNGRWLLVTFIAGD
jgi:Bacterial SH3 domain